MHNNEKKQLKRLVSDEVMNLLKETSCYIAGGAVTSVFCNREVNDVDVYIPSFEALVRILKEVYTQNEDILNPFSLLVQHYTTKSILLLDKETGKQVQLIHFNFFKTPADIFRTFDFTCVMGAYSCAEDKFILHGEFLKHNSQRYLKFWQGTAFPLMSAIRVDKYREKGYTISKTEYLRILMACMQLDIKTWDDVAEHIGGLYGLPVAKVFDIEREFSLPEAMKQLGKLEAIEKYNTVETDWKTLKEHVYKQHNLDYKPVYLKVVADRQLPNTFTSFYNPNFVYKVGEIVNGGHSGVWYQEEDDISNATYYGYANSTIIQIEPVFPNSIRDGVMMGDVRVLGVWKDSEKVEEMVSKASNMLPF